MTARMNGVSWRPAFRTLFGGAGVIGAFAVGAVEAQGSATDAQWQPYVGCWQPTAVTASGQPPLLCVVPVAGSSTAVDLVTVANGKELARDRLDASGEPRAVSVGGCTGSETGQWSADKRRVYLRSDVACQSGGRRTSSGVLAMTPRGEWLDIQSISAGDGNAMRVSRYRDAGLPSDLPPDIVGVIAAGRGATAAARVVAGAPIRAADVIEATMRTGSQVVQALLAERGQSFQLDGRELAALADAGVPDSVTDMMVALSYPQKFTVARADGEAAVPAPTAAVVAATTGYAVGSRYPAYARPYDPYWSRYGYSPFGYGYGLGYGYGYGAGYGYGIGYGLYGGGYIRRSYPYAIVVNGSQPTTSHGVAVNGQGYTRGGASTGRSATRTRVSAPAPASAGRGSMARPAAMGRTAHGRH